MKWHSIETAPTDGTYILLGYQQQGDEMPHDLFVGIGSIHARKLWILNSHDNEKAWPSHWAPLPDPPNTNEEPE